MGAMGQGNAREGYGEEASEKNLELQVMAFSTNSIVRLRGKKGASQKYNLTCSVSFFFILVMKCSICYEMCACKDGEKKLRLLFFSNKM